VWRVRRQERSSVIEIFKMEESGWGDILSNEFVDWRMSMAANGDGGSNDKVPEAGS
jgi:RAT1-interacting protein